jgi:hypothetical protein
MSITPQGISAVNVATDVKTIVAGFNANINVTADVADGFIVKLQKGAAVLADGTFASGKAKVSLLKASVTPGPIDVIVYNASGDAVAAASINAVAYDPAIWVTRIGGESNNVVAYFNTPIELDNDLFDVKVNGVSVPGVKTSAVRNDGKSFVINGVMIGGGGQFDIQSGAKFEISGILLPDLFPDYAFTYRAVYE